MPDAHVVIVSVILAVMGWGFKTLYFNHVRHWRAEIKDLKERMDALSDKLDKHQASRGECRKEIFDLLRKHGEDLALIKGKMNG